MDKPKSTAIAYRVDAEIGEILAKLGKQSGYDLAPSVVARTMMLRGLKADGHLKDEEKRE